MTEHTCIGQSSGVLHVLFLLLTKLQFSCRLLSLPLALASTKYPQFIMKLFIQILALLPVTLGALLVDFNAARGDDPKLLGLRNLEAARDEKRSDNAADLYIKSGRDVNGTAAAHFHRDKGNIRAEYHALNKQTQAGKTYWIGYHVSITKIQKGLMIWQL